MTALTLSETKTEAANIHRLVLALAIVISLAVMLFAPTIYLVTIWQNETEHQRIGARRLAGEVAKFAYVTGPEWPFSELRLSQVLTAFNRSGSHVDHTTNYRILDNDDQTLSDLDIELSSPILRTTAPIMSAGKAIGRVETELSFRDEIKTAGIILIFSTILAGIAFATIWIFPMRYVQSAFERLIESETALHDRIDELRKMQDILQKMAHHDVLTGLPNRILFDDRLRHAAAQAKRRQGSLAILYVDLDGFKAVNDRLGHLVGDGVLKEVARRMKESARQADTIARIGGDEFSIVVEDMVSRESVESTARRMLDALKKPMSFDGQTCAVGASIGISVYPKDTENLEELVKLADAAMYYVKEHGRNNVRFHGG